MRHRTRSLESFPTIVYGPQLISRNKEAELMEINGDEVKTNPAVSLSSFVFVSLSMVSHTEGIGMLANGFFNPSKLLCMMEPSNSKAFSC